MYILLKYHEMNVRILLYNNSYICKGIYSISILFYERQIVYFEYTILETHRFT